MMEALSTLLARSLLRARVSARRGNNEQGFIRIGTRIPTNLDHVDYDFTRFVPGTFLSTV